MTPGFRLRKRCQPSSREPHRIWDLNLGDFKYVTAPVVSVGRGEPQTRQFAPPSGNPGSLDGQYVRSLMKQEHEEFSGIRPSDTKDYDPIVSAPSAGAPPPARPVIQPKQAGA